MAFVITGEPLLLDYDFGDAPDPTYPTLLASNGAQHLMPSVYLYEKDGSYNIVPGGAWGKMSYGTSNFVFDGYKLNALSDYTLIYYPDYLNNPLWPRAGIKCLGAGTTDGSGNIQLADDFDFSSIPITGDINSPEVKIWLVPSSSVDCTSGVISGWFPAEFLFENNLIDPSTMLLLGEELDMEPDGQPNAGATGDDINPADPDDEDGVVFPSLLVPGFMGDVTVTASTGGGLLDAWIDFNQNGIWDAGEQIFTNVALTVGANDLTFPVPNLIPNEIEPFDTFARFRFSTAGGLSTTGTADDGEVEDHKVTIRNDIKQVVDVDVPDNYCSGSATGSVGSLDYIITADGAGGTVTIIEYKDGVVPDPHPSGNGFSFAGNYFDIEETIGGTFSATLTFHYTENPTGYVNGVLEAKLEVAYYDGSAWVTIPGVLDMGADTFTCTIDHFTPFSLVGIAMDVTAVDITPVAVQSGTADVGILDLVFTNGMGFVDTITQIVVTSKNTLDSDVANVELYVDDGDGVFEPTGPGGDTLLPTGITTFSGGIPSLATFGGLLINVPVGTSHVFVAYDVAGGAVEGNFLDASIAIGGITMAIAGTNVALLDPLGQTVIDDTPPTVVLTDNDTDYFFQGNWKDGLVKAGDLVTFTATFSEAMAATPQIHFTSTPCDDKTVAMSGSGTTWTYVWTAPTCSDSSDPTIYITVSGDDLAGNPYAGSDQLLFIYDNTPPAFTVHDGTDPGPVQTDTINVTVHENGSGIASSDYDFSADATCDASDFTGITPFTSDLNFFITGNHTDYLCVRAIDDAGHISYLTVGQLNTDNTSPTITGGTLAGDNSSITVNFSEGVHGSSPLGVSDFLLIFADNGGTATGVTIDSVTHTAGNDFAVLNLTVTNPPPDGQETIEIKPADGSSIYDEAGNPMDAAQTTGAINLNDKKGPFVETVDWNDTDGDTAISGGDQIVVTFSEAMNTGTITAGSLDADLGLSANSFGTTGNGLAIGWNGSNTILTITMGSDSTVVHGDTIDPAGTVTDVVGNPDATPSPVPILDDEGPVLAEVTPVPTPTSDNTPDYTFSSTEAGTISYGGSCSSATTAATAGNNTIIFNTLADGTYNDCTITVTDAFTNPSAALSVSAFTVDTTAPTLTTVSIVSSNVDPEYAKTGDTVTVSFTADETIQTPTVTIAGHAADSVTNPSGNNWTATRAMSFGDTQGTVAFTIDFDDLAGNPGVQVTATTDSSSVIFDSIVPTLTTVSIASDNADPEYAKVGDTVTVSFTASETIQTPPTVTIDGNAADSTTNTGGNNWTATRLMQTGDTEGVVAFTINFDDMAGNPGVQVTTVTDASSVTFNETNPTVLTFSPPDGDTGVAVDTNLVITFSENVQVGTGNIVIKKSSDDSVVATIPIGDAQVSFAGATVTINPTADLADSTSHYVLIDATAVTDLAGNPYAGISNKTVWNFLTVFGENGGNIIMLGEGWNVFSTPRLLESIEFSNGGTDINFYKLEGGIYDTTTTAATTTNIKPLEGFLVNNTSGDDVDVYLNYEDGVTDGQEVKLFTKALDAGWNIVGVADQSFEADDVDYTEVDIDLAFDSMLNQFANIIDYTDDFGDDDDNQIDSSEQISSTQTEDKEFEEFKAYPVFIRQGGAMYGGSQKDEDPV